MDLRALTEEARELMELATPATIPLPKLKKTTGHYGYDPDRSAVGTRADRAPKAASGGDKTAAGIKPKDISKTHNPRDSQKTKATPAKGGSKPSCPGGQAPRMVFGKWRCSAPTSKGAQKAKSRIATKRKKKTQKVQAPKGTIAKLVHKARSALVNLFK